MWPESLFLESEGQMSPTRTHWDETVRDPKNTGLRAMEMNYIDWVFSQLLVTNPVDVFLSLSPPLSLSLCISHCLSLSESLSFISPGSLCTSLHLSSLWVFLRLSLSPRLVSVLPASAPHPCTSPAAAPPPWPGDRHSAAQPGSGPFVRSSLSSTPPTHSSPSRPCFLLLSWPPKTR